MTEFKTVGTVDEIAAGEAMLVYYGRFAVLLFNIDGEYFAIEDRCSHEDFPLSEGEIDLKTCQIECAKHGALFDIKTGDALSPPAILPAKTFDVRVEGDSIQIAPR